MINSLRALKRRFRPKPSDKYIEWLRTNGNVAFIHINKCGGTSVETALGIPKVHDTALQRIEKIGRERWDELFTFSIVRHPYSKVASHYRYRIKTGQTGMGNAHISLNDWIEEAYGNKNPRYYDHPQMFAPCLDWISDLDGRILVDRVLKLENISEDWEELRVEAKIDAELPHRNSTQRSTHDLSDRSRNIIDEHFNADFRAFGYHSNEGA